MLDCLLRHGVIAPDAPEYVALAALRHRRTRSLRAAGA